MKNCLQKSKCVTNGIGFFSARSNSLTHPRYNTLFQLAWEIAQNVMCLLLLLFFHLVSTSSSCSCFILCWLKCADQRWKKRNDFSTEITNDNKSSKSSIRNICVSTRKTEKKNEPTKWRRRGSGKVSENMEQIWLFDEHINMHRKSNRLIAINIEHSFRCLLLMNRAKIHLNFCCRQMWNVQMSTHCKCVAGNKFQRWKCRWKEVIWF